MLFIFDIDRKKLVTSAGSGGLLTTIEGKRGEGEEIAVQIIQDGTPTELGVDAEIKFVAKSTGEYDPDPLVAATDFVYDSTSELYRAEVSWITDVLNAMFGVQSDTPQTVSGGVAATNVITTSAPHGLSIGNRFYFPTLTGGAGLESGTTSDVQRYYVLTVPTSSTLTFSATPGGTVFDFTTDISAATLTADPTDVDSVDLAVEVAWREDGTAKWKRSENDVALTLLNNYLRDDDGAAALTAQVAADTFVADRAVLYDRVQGLSGPEIAQALDNLGCSANVQAILAAADYAAVRTLLTLVIGTDVQAYDADLDTWAGITPSANVQSLVSAADYAAIRTLLGLVIGTNVQAYDAELAAIAGLTSAADKVPYFTGSGSAALADLTTVARALLAYSTVQAQINALMAASGALSQGDIFYRDATNVVRLAAGTAGYRLQTNGAAANPTWEEVAVPRGHLTGLTLSNNVSDATNDIDVATGIARDTTNAQNLTLAAAITKQLDAAWSVGSAAGGLDQGSIANATYHTHLIKRTDTGVVDAIFSLSHDESAVVTMTIASPCVVTWGTTNKGHGLVAGSPFKFSTTGALPTGVVAGTQYFVIATGLTETTFQFSATNGGSAVNSSGTQSGVHTGLAGPLLPTSYTVFRRIGSIVRASAAILAFNQDGDDFNLVTPALDVNDSTLTTSRKTYALASIPVGLRLRARFRGMTTQASANTVITICDLNEADAAPSFSAAPLYDSIVPTASGIGSVLATEKITNASAQIGARSSASSTTLRLATLGWRDRRGRDR